jgi:hypothetical protein
MKALIDRRDGNGGNQFANPMVDLFRRWVIVRGLDAVINDVTLVRCGNPHGMAHLPKPVEALATILHKRIIFE